MFCGGRGEGGEGGGEEGSSCFLGCDIYFVLGEGMVVEGVYGGVNIRKGSYCYKS